MDHVYNIYMDSNALLDRHSTIIARDWDLLCADILHDPE
jgi:hypothetical protein